MPVIETLKYHIPGLGELKADLYENSSDAYYLLKEKGHVDRLKKIDQLGVIRKVYEGLHHSRWEYVMMQLVILNRLNINDSDTGNKPAKGLGLGTDEIINSRKTTYHEIIQMWIMLLNMGHLPGTFSSEKALLKCIKEDSELKKCLKESLPNEEIESYFEEIVDKENIYDLHKVLSFLYLYKHEDHNPELVRYLIKINELFCFGPHVIDRYTDSNKKDLEIKLDYIKQIFNKIRQISYIYLDSKYGPIPFSFDLECILINLSEYIDRLFIDNNSSLSQSINDFDKFLSSAIYQSEESLLAQGFHVRIVTKRIKRKCETEEIYEIANLIKFLKDDKCFYYNYNYADDLDLNSKIKCSIYAKDQDLLAFLGGEFSFDRYENILNFEYEDRLNIEYGIENCLVSIEPSIKKENYNISFSFSKGCDDPQRFEILGKFLKELIYLDVSVRYHPSHNPGKDFIFIYNNLFLYLLRQISKNECIFKFGNHAKLDLPCIGFRGAISAANSLKKMIKESEKESETRGKSRIHEVKSLENSLRNIEHRGPIIVCANQIEVLNSKRKLMTDIDGLGFSYMNGRLYLLMVEAKCKRVSAENESRKQLINNLQKKLKINTSAINSVDKYIKELDKSVYCYLPVDGKLF